MQFYCHTFTLRGACARLPSGYHEEVTQGAAQAAAQDASRRPELF